MMMWISDNWYIIVLASILTILGIIYIINFMSSNREEQIAKVKEWLLYAVTMAEKELGSGTGAIKLRYVYDLFVTKFPWLARVIGFERFSLLVDEALDEMRRLLESNKKIATLINKE